MKAAAQEPNFFFCGPLVKLNGGRHVQGILRGFDPFMNLVVDDSLEMGPGGQQNTIGMVVSSSVSYCRALSSLGWGPLTPQ